MRKKRKREKGKQERKAETPGGQRKPEAQGEKSGETPAPPPLSDPKILVPDATQFAGLMPASGLMTPVQDDSLATWEQLQEILVLPDALVAKIKASAGTKKEHEASQKEECPEYLRKLAEWRIPEDKKNEFVGAPEELFTECVRYFDSLDLPTRIEGKLSLLEIAAQKGKMIDEHNAQVVLGRLGEVRVDELRWLGYDRDKDQWQIAYRDLAQPSDRELRIDAARVPRELQPRMNSLYLEMNPEKKTLPPDEQLSDLPYRGVQPAPQKDVLPQSDKPKSGVRKESKKSTGIRYKRQPDPTMWQKWKDTYKTIAAIRRFLQNSKHPLFKDVSPSTLYRWNKKEEMD